MRGLSKLLVNVLISHKTFFKFLNCITIIKSISRNGNQKKIHPVAHYQDEMNCFEENSAFDLPCIKILLCTLVFNVFVWKI